MSRQKASSERKLGQPLESRSAEVDALYLDGRTQLFIAKTMNCARSSVAKYLNRHADRLAAIKRKRQTAVAKAASELFLQDKTERVRIAQAIVEENQKIMNERGLIVREVRIVREGSEVTETIEKERYDRALATTTLAALRYIAEELGEYNTPDKNEAADQQGHQSGSYVVMYKGLEPLGV